MDSPAFFVVDEQQHVPESAATLVSDTINNNIENENLPNVSNNIRNTPSKLNENIVTNNSSQLNPNAIPFYPLKQLQNLNNQPTNEFYNANLMNVSHMNHMQMFQQNPGQILVLTLPAGLPIHNQSGIQVPQMIIPLQIPVPPSSMENNYYQSQAMAPEPIVTTPNTPMSISPFSETIEVPRFSSPMCEFNPIPFMCDTPVTRASSPIAIEPIVFEEIDQFPVVNEITVTSDGCNEEEGRSGNAENIDIPIPAAVPQTRYKIPSPNKITTRSRGRKVVESEKRSLEDSSPSTLAETIPDNSKKVPKKPVKPRVVLVRAKKTKAKKSDEARLPSKIEYNKTLTEVATAEDDVKDATPQSEVPILNVIKSQINEAMDTGVTKTDSDIEIKPTLSEKPKTKAKNKNQIKNQSVNVETPVITTVKEEPVQIEENIQEVLVQTKPEPLVTIKPEPADPIQNEIDVDLLPELSIKNENVISLIDEDEEELPTINLCYDNLPSFSQQTAPSSNEEEKRFNDDVEHYSKPEVQCAIFFPKLVVKRNTVRADNCSVEYAVTGRSHCRVCKQMIKIGELRFSIPVRDSSFGYESWGRRWSQARVIDHWHHARCFWGAYKLRAVNNMDGFSYLTTEDQRLILECVKQLK